jgi:hypothetical protein
MLQLRLRTCSLLLLIGVLTLAGCSSTELVNQWSNPAYTSTSFKRILVIGVTRQASIRRNFEDAFVAQLKAAGVDAVPGYGYMQEDGQVGEERLKQAVAQAGADAVIITRLVKREQKTVVTPGYLQPAPGVGLYNWYSVGWSGYYEPPSVYQYEVYTSETSLYDMVKNQVVWSGTAQTASQGDIDKEIKNYAEIMVAALKQKNLI